MNACLRWFSSMLSVAVCVGAGASPARAQVQEKQPHVVTLAELDKETARHAETRQANEDAIRHLLSSEEGQKALNSANVDYRRVDKAIAQLSDEEVARLADRSRRAPSDFAAGLISAKTLAYIILATVVIVVIIVLV